MFQNSVSFVFLTNILQRLSYDKNGGRSFIIVGVQKTQPSRSSLNILECTVFIESIVISFWHVLDCYLHFILMSYKSELVQIKKRWVINIICFIIAKNKLSNKDVVRTLSYFSLVEHPAAMHLIGRLEVLRNVEPSLNCLTWGGSTC